MDLLVNSDEASFTNTTDRHRTLARHPLTQAERDGLIHQVEQLLMHGKRAEAVAVAQNGVFACVCARVCLLPLVCCVQSEVLPAYTRVRLG